MTAIQLLALIAADGRSYMKRMVVDPKEIGERATLTTSHGGAKLFFLCEQLPTSRSEEENPDERLEIHITLSGAGLTLADSLKTLLYEFRVDRKQKFQIITSHVAWNPQLGAIRCINVSCVRQDHREQQGREELDTFLAHLEYFCRHHVQTTTENQ